MGKKGKKEVSPIELNDLERIREYFDEKKDKKSRKWTCKNNRIK